MRKDIKYGRMVFFFWILKDMNFNAKRRNITIMENMIFLKKKV